MTAVEYLCRNVCQPILFLFPVSNLKVCVSEVVLAFRIAKVMVRCGTQFGTQKGAQRAVDAVHAVRIFPGKFSAC